MRSPDERIVTLLKEARLQLEAERSRRSEPIAIVGIGCRFPGGASSPTEFWRLLGEGFDATSEVPAARWRADEFYDPEPDAPGKTYTKRGSFLLGDVDGFDAEFFGISPREAVGVDPQQRLLLECAWEALEDAGIVPERLRGSATGVWVGLCVDDYARRSLLSGDGADIDAYNTLGSTRSVAAGRISYVLDLHGPTVQLDTACSSSLVTIHQACQSLRLRECDLALAAGVNLMLAPEPSIALSKLRALAPDGCCKTFDASADGYGRGEGCGIVVLKRLTKAEADGDRIYAVIRGSACNHDGHSNGLTAPSGIAQEAVIRAALANGGVEAASVGYVEAHGTGTLLGDPIEVLAIHRVYGQGRAAASPLYLGAVKTNFGHLEGAAGVAGVIKAALTLKFGQIPRHLHLKNPNPKIPWAELAVKIATEPVEWARSEAPRLAGVSSFGISGTNAHVVLEEAPSVQPPAPTPARAAELILLSAKTPEALSAAARGLLEHMTAHPQLAFGDVASSLVRTRSLFDHRLALTATSQSLLGLLAAAASGQTPVGVQRGVAAVSAGKLAWLFTGQGAQRLGMGQELYAEWPTFRQALDTAIALFDPSLEVPLREVMWADVGSPRAGLLDQTGYTQLALFALEWALAQLWLSWGVTPDLLLGHSIGEITAATVAGVFSLEDAARLVLARARLMQALPVGGAMVSLAASEARVLEALRPYATTVSIAAVNGPTSVVIAGSEADVAALAERLRGQGIQAKRLSVSHAFHSPLMDPMLGLFQEVAESISYQPARIPIISDTTGALAGVEISTPGYWVRHVRNTIHFAGGVQTLSRAGADTFLELGPRPTLLGLIPSCLPGSEPALLPSLRPSRSEPEAVLDALGAWIARGGNAEWKGVFPSEGPRVSLPNYPWQRERYWLNDERRRQTERPLGIELEILLRRLAERGRLSSAAQSALPAILAALTEERAVPELDRTISSWLYALTWRLIPSPPRAAVSSGVWAVLGLRDGPALQAALQRAGRRSQLTDLEGLARLLEGPEVLQGVACLMDAWEHPEDQMLAIERLLARGAHAPRVWWITRGAVGTSPEDPPSQPAQAVIWGLGRSFALEHPKTWGGLIDLPPSAVSDTVADQAVASLVGAHGEDQLALRGDRVLAPRIVPQSLDHAHPMRISGRGTALITGGLGALGLHVARWLVQRGVRHLVLISRHGLATAGAPQAVAELELLGARVSVAAADVVDRGAMTSVLRSIPSDAPLTSVFHIAGVSDLTRLEVLEPQRLADVLAAKREGTLLLDGLTRDQSLEAFVCFSSISGVWGAGGQAAYAAANAFLDAWAHAARAAGRPAFSISWGPWADGGMADEAARLQLQRRGLHAMDPRHALHALERVLCCPPAHTTVVHVDWRAFRKGFEAWGPRPMLEELGPAGQDAPEREARSALQDSLAALPMVDRAKYLRSWIMKQCAEILGHRSEVQLDPERGFFDLGMDSLMVVELRNRLERNLNQRISPSVAFSHPSIRALVDYLLRSESLALPTQPPESVSADAAGVGATDPVRPPSTDEELLEFINSRFAESNDEPD